MTRWFEGWYFKQQAGKNMLALIPAYHIDGAGNRTGSLQVITPDRSWYVPLPGSAVTFSRKPLVVRADGNVFSLRGIELNVRHEDVTVSGRLCFTGITEPRGDIMGPFRFVPFMECRHSVFSLGHNVSGSVTVNGTSYNFDGGTGYTEGDRGRSFPKRYVWAHCSWQDGGNCSLMLSAADVRPFGRDFTGIIGFVRFRGWEYRLATYRGARILSMGNGTLLVRQGDRTLAARLLESSHRALRAPADGEMVRLVKESLCCRARFTMTEKNEVLFDFESDRASFEYEI